MFVCSMFFSCLVHVWCNVAGASPSWSPWLGDGELLGRHCLERGCRTAAATPEVVIDSGAAAWAVFMGPSAAMHAGRAVQGPTL